MKKLIFLFVSLLTFTVSAQITNSEYSIVVADVDIMKPKRVEYIDLVEQQKLMSFDVIVFLNYGQKVQWLGKAQPK
jgi:hypothetical protein